MYPSTIQRKEVSVSLFDLDDEPPPASGDFFALTCTRPPEPFASPGTSRDIGVLTRPRVPRSARTNPLAMRFRRVYFPDVSDREWSDWHWQMANRIRTPEQLRHILRLSEAEREGLTSGGAMLPAGITPHYMALIDAQNPDHPIRRTVIPTRHEQTRGQGEADDPLDEDRQSPLPGLVHRYPDRVLLLATDECATYCRYCTRSRAVGLHRLTPSTDRLEAAFSYIRGDNRIRDVLVSGGDPLMLNDERLDWLLANLRAIPHVEILRIGTKTPAVLPQRITPALMRKLRRHHPLWLSLHFTHPDECVLETRRACALLADSGIPLGSQTVLLKGINDDLTTLRALMHNLMQMRVRPYYLYQCDPITGSAHFRTSVEKGLEIVRGLRGHTSGYAVPTYVIDAPGGGGKIPIMPDAVVARDADGWSLRNHDGQTYRYPDHLQR